MFYFAVGGVKTSNRDLFNPSIRIGRYDNYTGSLEHRPYIRLPSFEPNPASKWIQPAEETSEGKSI
jgi:hypothetical protein